MNFDHPPGRFIGQPIPAEDAGERLRHWFGDQTKGDFAAVHESAAHVRPPGCVAFGAVRKRLPCGEQLLRTVRIRYPGGTPSEYITLSD